MLVVLLVLGCGIGQDDEEGAESLWCNVPDLCFDATVQDFDDALPGLDIGFSRFSEWNYVSYWRADNDGISVTLRGRASSETREPSNTISWAMVDLHVDGDSEPTEAVLREFLSVVRGFIGVAVPGWVEGPSWVRKNMGDVAGVEDAVIEIAVVIEDSTATILGGEGTGKGVHLRLLGPCDDYPRPECGSHWVLLSLSPYPVW